MGFSTSKIMFAAPSHRDVFEQIQNPFISRIVYFDEDFEQFINQSKSDWKDFECKSQSIDDNIAVILCSSGTTGLPKGVQITQKNVMISVEQHMYKIY